MIADLDHFKDVNDRYGHLTGNEVLETVAEKISSEVRNDDIVGRFGGEEFIIVLKNTNNDFAYKKAECIRKKIEETRFSIKGLSVTISIGACEWNRESLNGLIKKADDAMYAAKLKGRNRVEMCGS
jgi:diguanylate cyclase (GGDEF)-like protein